MPRTPRIEVSPRGAARVAGLALALLVPAAAQAGEVTRTVRGELPAGARFAVENLVGTMTVVPGTGTSIVAVATVHAEDASLADAVTLEAVKGKAGVATLRVRYPYGRVSTFRYGRGKDSDGSGGFLSHLFSGSSSSEYDGERVRVSSRDGKLLYADVEVQLPRGASLEGELSNHFGAISARDVAGSLRFASGSGDVELTKLGGSLKAETGSGDVKASGIAGELECETGSGTCNVSDVTGERVGCETGSGDIALDHVKASRVKLETGSGDIGAQALDAQGLEAETGSGDIEIDARSGRLEQLEAETGSGDVTLKLGATASFEVMAEQGSGDLTSRFEDAQPIVRHREVIGYRRGSGGAKIEVETGSGDVTIEP